MIDPRMTPERLPTTMEAAFPGRFVSSKRAAKATPPTDSEAKPESLLGAGVFIPDPK